jgi:hypothetical protein
MMLLCRKREINMVPIQSPSLILLVGQAARFKETARELMATRLSRFVPQLATFATFDPDGDHVAQMVTVADRLQQVLSAETGYIAHNAGIKPVDALRLIILCDIASHETAVKVALHVAEGVRERRHNLIAYDLVVHVPEALEDAPGVKTLRFTFPADFEQQLQQLPAETKRLYVSTQDEYGHRLPAETVWIRTLYVATWLLDPMVAGAVDRQLLDSDDPTRKPIGSVGIIRYVSDPDEYARESAVALTDVLLRRLSRTHGDPRLPEEEEVIAAADELQLLYQAHNGDPIAMLREQVRQITREPAWDGQALQERLMLLREATSMLEGRAQTAQHALTQQIIGIELDRRFPPEEPPAPPVVEEEPEPDGLPDREPIWLVQFFVHIWRFITGSPIPYRPPVRLRPVLPPPPTPAPPDPLPDLRDRLQELKRCRQQLTTLLKLVDLRIAQLQTLASSEAKPAPAEPTGPIRPYRNVFDWHRWRPHQNPEHQEQLLNDFVAAHFDHILDGEATETAVFTFMRELVRDDAMLEADAFLARCADVMPGLINLLFDEAVPLWPVPAFDTGRRMKFVILPNGEDSPLAHHTRSCGALVESTDRPEVHFIQIAYGV